MQSVAVNEILPKCELLPVPVVVPPNLEGQVGVYPACSCVTALIFSGTFVGTRQGNCWQDYSRHGKERYCVAFWEFRDTHG